MEGNRLEQAHDQHCSDQQLIEMLGSHSGPEHFSKLLEHVESCSQCQHKLDQLAADSTLWSDAAIALTGYSSSDSFHAGMPTMQLNGLLHNHQQATNWTEAMAKQLLTAPSHPEMLGRIGRYEVERLIGAGGMGIVFKALDSELNRTVAIKLLAPYLAGNGSARQRFSREAKAAAAVVHEHVVPIHNVETDGDCPYLVMRYVAGDSLQQRIDRDGPMDTCQVLRIAKQIASGLAAAHAQGLIHRDIKPSNILVESGVERSLITDFGLARAADDASLTNTGYHPGTPQYMSPEQARGDSIDARSDLFSLGSLMYTMCTGRAPFRAETSYGILRKITDTEPLSIQDINPNIPRWLSAIVAALMSKSAEDRIQTSAELEELLEGCLAHVQRPTVHELPPLALKFDQQAKSNSNKGGSTAFSISRWSIVGLALVAFVAAIAFAMQRGAKQESSIEPNSKTVKTAEANTDRSRQKARSRVAASPTASDLLRQKITQPTKLSLKDASLAEALKQLCDNTKVEFEINEPSFEDQQKILDTRITLEASASTREVLNRILQRVGASYIVRDRVVEIVSTEYARKTPVFRQYDLGFVFADNSSINQLTNVIGGLLGPEHLQNPGSSSVSIVDSILVVRAREVDHVSIENLLAQLSSTLQPSPKK